LEAKVFGLILIFAVTVMQGYLFWRAASVPFVRRRIPRKLLIGIGIALWAIFLLGRFVGSGNTGSAVETLELLSMTWLGMLFLMSLTMFAADAATGFGLVLKRVGSGVRGVSLAAGGVLCLVALAQGLRAPVVQDHDVYLAGLPERLEGTVIVALCDLHLGPVLGERWLAARVEQVQLERPDIVVLLGDVFEGHNVPGQELIATLRRLSAPQGVWAVLGNHEFHGNHTDISTLFEEAGIHLLRDAWHELRPGLVLAGMDTFTASHNGAEVRVSLAKALAGRTSGATILLSHAPLPESVVAGKGMDLVLSGHTHGGQIWPFDYLVRQRFPLLEGRQEHEGTTVIVSRGTGTWGPPMRLWQPGEILRVTLHARKRIPAPSR
jgi:hypothetical protein